MQHKGSSSDNPKTFSAGGNKGLRGAAIRKRDASCVYTLNIDSGGQVIGDGFNPNTAPTELINENYF